MAQRSKPSLENPRLDGHPWTHRNKGCPDHAPIAPHRRAAGRRPAAGPAARSRQRHRGGGTGACRPAHGPVATNRGDRQRDPPGRCGNRGADQRPARRGAAPTGRDQHRGTDRPAFRQPGRIQLQSLGRQRHRRRLVRRPARNRREQDPGAASTAGAWRTMPSTAPRWISTPFPSPPSTGSRCCATAPPRCTAPMPSAG